MKSRIWILVTDYIFYGENHYTKICVVNIDRRKTFLDLFTNTDCPNHDSYYYDLNNNKTISL